MKRIVTAFACALVVGAFQVNLAEAQVIGFKLGSTWSKMDIDPGDEDDSSDLLSAFGGGGFVRFGLMGLSLQAEVLAVTKGSKSEDPLNESSDEELELDYIEVPITALFAIGSGPYVFVGPSFAFETGCENEVTIAGNSETINCDEDGSGVIQRKTFDIGLTGGLGFHFNAGPGAILLEGRYTHGLTNLYDGPGDDNNKLRNRSFGAFAGYAVPIGGR